MLNFIQSSAGGQCCSQSTGLPSGKVHSDLAALSRWFEGVGPCKMRCSFAADVAEYPNIHQLFLFGREGFCKLHLLMVYIFAALELLNTEP